MSDRKHQVVSRPATKEDLEKFTSEVKWPTAKAWIGEIDGEPVAIGGIAFFNKRWVGFLDITEKGREYLKKSLMVKVALIRVMVEGLREAKKMNVRYIYTWADLDHDGAEELLERMGFHKDPRNIKLWRWKSDDKP